MTSRFPLYCFCVALAVAPAVSAAGPALLPALDAVQPGQWILKERGGPGAGRSMCVRDPRVLVQLEHGSGGCGQLVISSGPPITTVEYSCPGRGHGRTTIRVETPRLLQIETQGIYRNEPFARSIEARRTGDCATISGVNRPR
jgi:hypothetical protein